MPRLTNEQIKTITHAFYSGFCGMDLTKLEKGVHFVCSQARAAQLRGYGCKYGIYALVKEDSCVVAYEPAFAAYFDSLQGSDAESVLAALNRDYKLKKMQLMIFTRERVQDYGNARVLTAEDYPLYERFFRTKAPKADPAGWLQEYFVEKTANGYFTGCFADGVLASVCDAPDMPYMEGIIQHTGIVTLPAERRKGYARCAAALAAHQLIENGICPQWECRADNEASVALAEAIGYEKYGTAYILEN